MTDSRHSSDLKISQEHHYQLVINSKLLEYHTKRKELLDNLEDKKGGSSEDDHQNLRKKIDQYWQDKINFLNKIVGKSKMTGTLLSQAVKDAHQSYSAALEASSIPIVHGVPEFNLLWNKFNENVNKRNELRDIMNEVAKLSKSSSQAMVQKTRK